MFVQGNPTFVEPRDRTAFYVLRLLTVVLGLATLLVVWRTVACMTDDEPTRFLAVLLPATLPQYVFVSSYVTADGLLGLVTALAAWCLVRIVRDPARMSGYVGLGAAVGVGLMVKKTALFLLPGLGVTLGALAVTRRRDTGAVVRGTGVLGVLVVALAGWIFVRNALLYGDPMGNAMERATLPSLYYPRSITDQWFRGEFPLLLSASFDGLLSWMNLWLPAWVYWLYAGLGVAAVVGLLRRLRDPWTWLAALFVGTCLAGVVVYNLTFPQPQGRYLFAALPFVAFLAATGLRSALPTGRSPWPAIAGLAVVLVAVDATTLVTVWSFFDGR
jgi:4-amino-4-deoxy-L-arabinose transferase-like glycosyltransferase